MALQQLEDRIERHLQDYLGMPHSDRTFDDYMGLRTNLARCAQDFAKQVNEERRTQIRQQRKGVGR